MEIGKKTYRYFLCLLLFTVAGCAGYLPNSSAGGCYLDDYPEPTQSPYILPYAPGWKYAVVRGNCSRLGHNNNSYGNLSYAYDFSMPVGTELLAIRGGKVISVVDEFSNGDDSWDHANFITIEHDDGTYAQYVHIAHNSVPVVVGQTISQGHIIGKSGDTGVTSAPKLHLEVINSPIEECVINKATANCLTTHVTFRNASPQPGALIERRSYQALPFD